MLASDPGAHPQRFEFSHIGDRPGQRGRLAKPHSCTRTADNAAPMVGAGSKPGRRPACKRKRRFSGKGCGLSQHPICRIDALVRHALSSLATRKHTPTYADRATTSDSSQKQTKAMKDRSRAGLALSPSCNLPWWEDVRHLTYMVCFVKHGLWSVADFQLLALRPPA